MSFGPTSGSTLSIGYWLKVTSGANLSVVLINDANYSTVLAALAYLDTNNVGGIGQPLRLLIFGMNYAATAVKGLVNMRAAPCVSSPACLHQGICTGTGQCDCPPNGWTGPSCSTPVCNIVPCNSRQYCSAPDVCSCVAGFSGVNCSAVDGGMSEWSSWTKCAGGSQWRTRSCTNPVPSFGGRNCSGAFIETQPCMILGPAQSCAPDGTGSDSACCTLLDQPSLVHPYFTFSWDYSIDYINSLVSCAGRTCPLCYERSASNTVDAAKNEREFNNLGLMFQRFQCWGGEVAVAPGSSVYQLSSAGEFVQHLLDMSCLVTFQVDGGISAWSDWNQCNAAGQQMRSRNCTNPVPRNGGANCSETVYTQTQRCNPAAAAGGGFGPAGNQQGSGSGESWV